jgi:hypothetical protein
MLKRGILGRLENALQAQQPNQGQEVTSENAIKENSNGLPGLSEVLMKLQNSSNNPIDSPVPPAEPVAIPTPDNLAGTPSAPAGILPTNPAAALLQGLESLLPNRTCSGCQVLLVRFEGVANFLLIICNGGIVAITINDTSFNLLMSIGVPSVTIPVIAIA